MDKQDLAELRSRIGDRVVIASVSGGKDSTAMCLHLKELGIPYIAVNMDTGWEHADTDHYVREVLPDIVGPIETISADWQVRPEVQGYVDELETLLGRPSQMARMVLHKAMFPSRIRRFCTQELKLRPMSRYVKGLEDEPVNAVGVRAAESAARAKLPEWEWWKEADCEQWRPLLSWSDQDVVDIHKRHSVPPNPLYLRGAHRVGCWPCIYARKSEIRNIADTDPARIAVIARLEEIVTQLARDKFDEAGTLPKYEVSGWFMGPTRHRSETSARAVTPWPIARVVEWAKTKRGGRQVELFAPPAREWGCMRWGVCDTGASTDTE
jgi:3'-phosphoadenosine 5'-phosphosulfate sulfotransferase (PAPS reductase)/FAD synthetase